MILYVELWNTRPAWLALSPREQSDYMARVQSAIDGFREAGVDVIGFAINEAETLYRGDYYYLAVWRSYTDFKY